ncbi:MAG: HAD-IB family hydrolase [Flavobacteriales bacterium]|nr:MAG: HAD-IB family hydrolase [Flavobacteriales bacterium]
MKKIYCFDFDGTLTYKDTMFLFLKFYNTKRYYFQFLKHFPLFILLKMKLVSATKVKRSFIFSIIKDDTRQNIEHKAQLFFEQNYPNLIRENALSFIDEIDREHTAMYLVSASLDIWLKPFAERLGMNLISTQAEFKDEKFTGRFMGKNCNGEEKVNRLQLVLKGKKYDKIIAFGDTKGDKPMLNWANKGHYRFFH